MNTVRRTISRETARKRFFCFIWKTELKDGTDITDKENCMCSDGFYIISKHLPFSRLHWFFPRSPYSSRLRPTTPSNLFHHITYHTIASGSCGLNYYAFSYFIFFFSYFKRQNQSTLQSSNSTAVYRRRRRCRCLHSSFVSLCLSWRKKKKRLHGICILTSICYLKTFSALSSLAT